MTCQLEGYLAPSASNRTVVRRGCYPPRQSSNRGSGTNVASQKIYKVFASSYKTLRIVGEKDPHADR